MSEEQMMTLILIIGVVIGMFSSRILDNLTIYYYRIRYIYNNNKSFAEKQAQVKAWRDAGNVHKWQEIPVNGMPTLVCTETGWCPKINGFIPKQSIESYFNAVKMDEEYKLFREKRIKELADRWETSIYGMEKIVESVFQMKKDFHLKKTTELQQELQAKAADVESTGKV